MGLTCEEFDTVLRGVDDGLDPDEYQLRMDEYHSLVGKADKDTADYLESTAEDRKQAKLSLKMIEEEIPPCPNPDCGVPSQKGDGCNFVLCGSCNVWFCWECRAIGIKFADGRTMYDHKESCSYADKLPGRNS